jgi:hypothetical protein
MQSCVKPRKNNCSNILLHSLALFISSLALSGCGNTSSTQAEAEPWWDELTEDTVFAVKSAQPLRSLTEKLPPEIRSVVEEYAEKGFASRLRVNEDKFSTLMNYLEVSVFVSSGESLEYLEDSKLYCAYRSAISPEGWEIRIMFSSADSAEIAAGAETTVREHNLNVLAAISSELESRSLPPPASDETSPSIPTSIMIEDGKVFLQIGDIPPSSPLRNKKLLKEGFKNVNKHVITTGTEWRGVLYLSVPHLAPPPTPQIPTWSPGYQVANAAIKEVASSWEKINKANPLSSLTEFKITSKNLAIKTLVDLPSPSPINHHALFQKIKWSDWPSAMVAFSAAFPFGKNNLVTEEFSNLLAKQLSLASIPFALETSVLMTEKEANENVERILTETSKKIHLLLNEIARSSADQVNFKLWADGQSEDNMALWLTIDNPSEFEESCQKMLSFAKQWTGFDVTSTLLKKETSSSSVDLWELESDSSSSTNLALGWTRAGKLAVASTSPKSALEILEKKEPREKSVTGLFCLSVNASLAAKKLSTLSPVSHDLENLDGVLRWIGRATIFAKLADPKTLEISLETLGDGLVEKAE